VHGLDALGGLAEPGAFASGEEHEHRLIRRQAQRCVRGGGREELVRAGPRYRFESGNTVRRNHARIHEHKPGGGQIYFIAAFL
jgi:hypothetical protein